MPQKNGSRSVRADASFGSSARPLRYAAARPLDPVPRRANVFARRSPSQCPVSWRWRPLRSVVQGRLALRSSVSCPSVSRVVSWMGANVPAQRRPPTPLEPPHGLVTTAEERHRPRTACPGSPLPAYRTCVSRTSERPLRGRGGRVPGERCEACAGASGRGVAAHPGTKPRSQAVWGRASTLKRAPSVLELAARGFQRGPERVGWRFAPGICVPRWSWRDGRIDGLFEPRW